MNRILVRLKSFLMYNRLNLLLAIFGVLISVAVAEGLYRAYLFWMIPKSQLDHLDFYVQNQSCSEYDELLGFHYKPNISCDWITIKDSLPDTSGTLAINHRGNSGPDADEADSEVKIAVVGDSFTVIQHDGITWPHLLHNLLREDTGRKVAVVNYARDGYGLLQMIDQASTLIDENPDVILIAFISPDLDRARFWRMEYTSPSGVDVFTSTAPSLQFDKPETYVRSTLVNPLATRNWAEKTKANKDTNDPVLRSLLDTYLRERIHHAITRFDPLSLRALYLWERLTHPHFQAIGIANPEVTYKDFVADHRLMDGVAKLKQSKIPVYLVHLPWGRDLAVGKYLMLEKQTSLLRSLKSITGFPLVDILPPVPMDEAADTLILSRDNPHPSLDGLEFYAHQIAQVLMRDSTFRNILISNSARVPVRQPAFK